MAPGGVGVGTGGAAGTSEDGISAAPDFGAGISISPIRDDGVMAQAESNAAAITGR